MSQEGMGFISTHPRAPSSEPSEPVLELVLVYPESVAGQRFALRAGLALGRSPAAGIVNVLHDTVSRRHAVVQGAMGGILCIHDLGSRNGTKLNGKTVTCPSLLESQSVVRLGDVLAVVDEPSDRRFDEDPVLRGTSAAMGRARELLQRAAADPAPVLVMGETGTGKERVAAEVHRLSGRAGPYLALNCAELSPELIESQLFGYERGAFTGASTSRTGLFAAAHGGTLFLDEIGELPLDLQPKLLRVLQEGEVRAVGGVQTRRVDVRIVAATNRQLLDAVERGLFRRDLYARLALWEILLPPLRERRRDILAWIALLLEDWNRARGTRYELDLLPDAAEAVLLHGWADNLRGLSRLVHRLAGCAHERPIGMSALAQSMPELVLGPATSPSSQREQPSPSLATRSTAPPRAPTAGFAALDEELGASRSAVSLRGRPSREELLAVYEALGGSVRATSKHFGKDRRQIYRWLESYGIPRDAEPE